MTRDEYEANVAQQEAGITAANRDAAYAKLKHAQDLLNNPWQSSSDIRPAIEEVIEAIALLHGFPWPP